LMHDTDHCLFSFAVQRVCATVRTEFLQFDTRRVVAAIFLSCVVSFLALTASKSYNRTNAFFSRHIFFLRSIADRPFNYSRILVMTPAPTVRPPSRMANFEPCSRATGTINSTVRFTLSPGMTISTPSGRLMSPVTSIVRM